MSDFYTTYGPTAAADAARSASTLAWSSPANALPDAAATSAGPFAPGLATHWLAATGFAPADPIPADARIVSLKATIRHRSVSTGAVPTPIVLSALECGALALAPARTVPPAFEDFDVDLTGLNPTPAALNAGIALRIAYDAVPGDAHAFDVDHWSFNLYSNGSVYPTNYPGPYGGSTTFAMVATYVGPGVAPSFVPVRIRSVSSAGGPYSGPGYVVLDNGQGAHVTGTIPNPPVTGVGPADSTVLYGLPVSGGTATKSLTITRSNTTATGDPKDFAMGGVYPTVTNPDPSTVEVESILLTVVYTTPIPPRIAYLAFGPRDEGLVWIRTTGAIDAAEWDPRAAHRVEGPNRDGGSPMPAGWWETARLPGAVRRLVRVEAERDGFGPLSLVAYTERAPSGERASLPPAGRWTRFSPGVQGRTHRLRMVVTESSGAIRAVDLVFDDLAGPGR